VVDPIRVLFEAVVRLLRPVLDDLVFVGGCTTGLFLTDPAASGIRPKSVFRPSPDERQLIPSASDPGG